MTTNTKRYIDIEGGFRVGFNYLKQQFYITYKGKTVYSTEAKEIYTVADVMGITTEITLQDIEDLAKDFEVLEKLSYTLQDNGAYIHTIQLNDFSNYPLTIDCEKQKLYIMNSNIIFDLTVDESVAKVRVPILRAYYKDTLGLQVSQHDMEALYNLLISYYKPTCYNQVELNENTLKAYYNNIFVCSNYDNTAIVVYNCTGNPNNTVVAIEDMPALANITSIDTNANAVYITDITPEDIKEGSKVYIHGINVDISGVNYSADGTYTVQNVLIDSQEQIQGIITAETLPISYKFPYVTCYVESAECNILEMHREQDTITVSGDIQQLLVGDKVIVRNAVVTGEFETIDLSGEYTIQSIKAGEEANTYIIQVEEEILTDYIHTTTQATLVKGVSVGDVSLATNIVSSGTEESHKITLINLQEVEESTIISKLKQGNLLYLSDNTSKVYIVDTVLENTIHVTEEVQEYNVQEVYPKLKFPKPSPEVLINVTSIDESVENVLPVGEFIVDTFEEVQDYLHRVAYTVKPSKAIKNNMYKEVPSSMSIGKILDNTEINTMEFKGLYSQIYKEE